MNSERLTIAIPTYNRHICVLSRIKELRPQLREGVRFFIIDNNSEPSITDYLKDNGVDCHGIEFFKNNCNIGGNANIARCIEYCNGGWLWILGDDDVVGDNAIDIIFNEIAMHPDVLQINFHCNNVDVKRPSSYILCGCDHFYKNVDNLHFFFLISNNIVNIRYWRENMGIVYQYLYTCLPHFVAFHMAMVTYPKKSIVLSEKNIVQIEVNSTVEGWSKLQVKLCALTFMELVMAPHLRRRIILLMREGRYDILRYCKYSSQYGLGSGDWGGARYLYNIYYSKYASSWFTLSGWFQYWFGYFSILIFSWSDKIGLRGRLSWFLGEHRIIKKGRFTRL